MNSAVLYVVFTVFTTTCLARTRPDIYQRELDAESSRSDLLSRILTNIMGKTQELETDGSAGGKGFLVEGLNGPSIHIHIPSLGARDCPDDVCEYYIEVKPVNPPVGTTSNSVQLCPKFDLSQSVSMSFSYGDFPEMIANEEYQVEICLNDRHGPVGQKCRAQLPCEVHRVHVGRATGGASEVIGEDSMIVVTDQETLNEIENEVDVEENQSSETEDAEHSLVEAARNVLNLLKTLDQ